MAGHTYFLGQPHIGGKFHLEDNPTSGENSILEENPYLRTTSVIKCTHFLGQSDFGGQPLLEDNPILEGNHL